MRGYKNAVINEVEKLYKKKKVIISAILSLISICIGELAVIALREGLGIIGAQSMDFPILVLSILVYTVLPLFTALVAVDSFSGEFSHNTMKILITRPISRFKVFCAKFTAIIIFILSNLLFAMLFSIIAGILFNPSTFSISGLIQVIISYFVTLFPMIVLALLVVFYANMIKSGTAVFFLAIITFIGFKALEIVLTKYSGIFFTSTFGWYKLWIMNIFPAWKILRQGMLLVSYSILLFTGSYYFFDKKEF
ncbi:ABC transporter permease [Clostridium cellulovorans]|uniref:Membrane spanning protein n=1 Tax=Clostridium cellulovorans (strain ATCC 35296 / DSM 3052 / OCM 3 / 743B) TaxID=573061 RepID=D9SRR5_CLOC7|nr:ABC transporter permease [Clostridium cellulovorans]ADL50432.1 membrane spanning protein [Clostridium cellulovorans 743B]